jgi:1-deoxy-D-xylulose-5-phosphate synthase
VASILDNIQTPEDVAHLPKDVLAQLARELRDEMIAATSVNGGHLASSLGAVEIILAAHRVLNLPHDKLLFDVGHQAYAHKLLTGRRPGFVRLRKLGGVSGFTRRKESVYDVHDAGHASDALPTALGLALARDMEGLDTSIVTVVGDASIAGGLSYEALNYIGQQQFKRFVIILNDNEMSISRSVGAFSAYLAGIRTSKGYTSLRDSVEEGISRSSKVGDVLMRLGERAKEATKHFLIPGMLFEDIGFTYLGPIDGNDVELMQEALERSLAMDKPVIIHAVTKKGLGYAPAEENPEVFHGVGPFDIQTGAIRKKAGAPSYTSVFSKRLIAEAEKNPLIVGITAAMPAGTGLSAFAERFPERFYDVGIAEECAVTMASGLAIGEFVPVVAIYSTFLQRAYDEIATNVCLQNLHVVFAVDRAGLVGEDGSTHHGSFDLAYLRTLPNLRIAAPSDEAELACALKRALEGEGPYAIRFPRGAAVGVEVPSEPQSLPMRARLVYGAEQGKVDVCLLAVGRMVGACKDAAARLESQGLSVRVCDMRWVKPVDAEAVRHAAQSSRLICTVEDGTVCGGFGSAVLECMSDEGLTCPTLRLGLPDAFVGHGSVDELFGSMGLDGSGIAASVTQRLGAQSDRHEGEDAARA